MIRELMIEISRGLRSDSGRAHLELGSAGRGFRDSGEQDIAFDRFPQIGAGTERTHTLGRAGFVMSRDDDDRHRNPPDAEGFQHLETIDPGQVKIQQYAVPGSPADGGEELIPALELLDPKPPGGQQPAERLPHFRFVVDHCYDWLCLCHRTDRLADAWSAPLLDLGVEPCRR